MGAVCYEVSFVTGDERGAETNSDVFATIVGETGELVIPVDGKMSFRRNSVDRVSFQTPSDTVGRIKHITVGHDGENLGSGWFLEKVVVNIVKTMEDALKADGKFHPHDAPEGPAALKEICLEFPYHAWVGTSDSGGHDGPLSVDLRPIKVPKRKHFMLHVTPTKKNTIILPSSPMTLQTAGFCSPHPDKVIQGSRAVCGKQFGYAGEDAYFCHRSGFIGVADGVYSWKEEGIDAGLFSRSLMHSALTLADKAKKELRPIRALDLVTAAAVDVAEAQILGSSTICVFGLLKSLNISGDMYQQAWTGEEREEGSVLAQCVNIGDSGVLIGRPSTREVLFRTSHQEHSFGFPYQLGHQKDADSVQDAQVHFIQGLKEGDIIVAGTDGLFDNLNDEEILSIVIQNNSAKGTNQRAAVELFRAAYERSMSTVADSPYSIAATSEYNMVYHGGKQDDITCIVASIVPDDS